MNHQLNSFFWDLPGPTLSLPQLGPHVGWVLQDAEAKVALGSSESLYSQSSSGNSFSPSTDFFEDLLSSPSLFDDGSASQVPLQNGSQEETIDFDFNFLPSSPECIDFTHLEMDDTNSESNADIYIPQDFIRKSATPENVDVERAVEDPDVALNLLKQLSAGYVSNGLLPNIKSTVGSQFSPLNVLPVGDFTLIQSQTPVANTALKLVSIAPIDDMPFQMNSFFATPDNSQLQSAPSNNNNIIISPNPTFTLRDLVSMPDIRQVILPAPVPVTFNNFQQLSASSIQFENVATSQKNSSPVMRPEKRYKKKEQNKNAATKYRQKKRREQGDFASECEETERRNCELKLRVNEITREINYLKGLLLEISVA